MLRFSVFPRLPSPGLSPVTAQLLQVSVEMNQATNLLFFAPEQGLSDWVPWNPMNPQILQKVFLNYNS